MEATTPMQEHRPLSTASSEPPTVFLGIGNPGTRYEATYHNAGLRAVARLAACGARRLKFRAPRPGASFAVASHGIYRFALSRTFMNESGKAAQALLTHLRRNPRVLAVFHDDADLAQGTVAVEFGRGAAGHHGVLSIIQTLGSQDFWRIRIGIRPPIEAVKPHGARGRAPAGDFVLAVMRKDALDEEAAAVDRALRDAFPTVFPDPAEPS